MSDWRDVEPYEYTNALSGSLWAWEFLRRNPRYRQEWRAFSQIWQVLEVAYGKPPNRDFPRWQQDPRAYVLATDQAGDDCRVDQDRVLIECALGERWGFYQFPQDPALTAPELNGEIRWRERPLEVHRVAAGDDPFIGTDTERLALGFDLRLPLREQLDRAKRHLQMLQRRAVRDGTLRMHTVENLRADWLLGLRCLDAERVDADANTVAGQLMGGDRDAHARCLHQAQRLRDGGYRDLPWLPEG